MILANVRKTKQTKENLGIPLISFHFCCLTSFISFILRQLLILLTHFASFLSTSFLYKLNCCFTVISER